MEELLKRLHIYDDIAVYAPGLLLGLAIALPASVFTPGLNDALLVIGLLGVSFPLGLLIQALASATLDRLIAGGRKDDRFARLGSADRDALRLAFGEAMGPSALFTRCVTRFGPHLDSYVKFKALGDICRSLAFIFVLCLLLPALLAFPSIRTYLRSTWIGSLSSAEAGAVLAASVVACIAAAWSLARRSRHFAEIAIDIVFDTAVVHLARDARTETGNGERN